MLARARPPILRLACAPLAALPLLAQVPPSAPAAPAAARLEGSVTAGDPIRFTYFFRNLETATAPARQVVVQTVLDPGLVPASVVFSEIAWGDHAVPLPDGARSFSGRLPFRAPRPGVSRTLWAEVRCGFSDERTVTWVFRTLDPRTGRPPEERAAGFLPPDDASHRGEGVVSFSVRTRSDLPPGTRIRNRATIAFDGLAPVETVTTLHDVLPPPSGRRPPR